MGLASKVGILTQKQEYGKNLFHCSEPDWRLPGRDAGHDERGGLAQVSVETHPPVPTSGRTRSTAIRKETKGQNQVGANAYYQFMI